jgi:hypothetical protein
MYTYLKVKWNHNFDDEPIYLYSELDYNRNEIRKVYIFRNGEIAFANENCSSDNIFLSVEPIPSNDEIALDNQFKPENISIDDFEKIWNTAIKENKLKINICDIEKMTPKEIVERNYDKVYWKKGAETLKLLELPHIIEIVPSLFDWLQDFNWPGSTDVMDILASLPRQVLIINLEHAIKVALTQNDQDWLYFMSIFIEIKNIEIMKNDFKDMEIYEAFILSINNY